MGEQEGRAVDDEDVLGVDGGEDLGGGDLEGDVAGDDFEAGSGEVVEVVVGGDPDAAGGVLIDGDDHALLDAVGCTEAAET